MAADWSLTVSQLNEYVRKSLSGDPMLRDIRVTGEISGFKRHFSGHLYFALKDESARVQCVMFRSDAAALDIQLADGMLVVARGSASLYAQSGTFQLYVQTVTPQGAGALYLKFEMLKRRLSQEGLFDPALKRAIPMNPRLLGVVTSRTGAVLHDICTVARRRNPNIDILLAPCAVQGVSAAREIAAAIEKLNQIEPAPDVILCGRGGGSIEDLWPFNEEIVARAIRASRVPVISCVGHETDFTIADFSADLRAPTPSAAAELAVPEVDALNQAIDLDIRRGERAIRARLTLQRARLQRMSAAHCMKDPLNAVIVPHRNRLAAATERLTGAMNAPLILNRARYSHARSVLKSAGERLMTHPRMRLDALKRRLEGQSPALTLRSRARLETLVRALEAVNPGNVLSRGYALVKRGDSVMARAADLRPGDTVNLVFADGSAEAVIKDEEELGHGQGNELRKRHG
ncbi:MAG: exodeoxyribonuclease VII large subunit [Clostridia bacterium]|nr:exodeoxyribonuclease VII large subunit [Clostridia bacterium]